jgi:hypothetical protein
MIETPALELELVRAEELPDEARRVLRPGEAVADRHWVQRTLPTCFYRVPSWDVALETRLTENFGLWELIDVDVREARDARIFPRFIPCAVAVLAAHLQLFRNRIGRVVRIAANGGYRSPSHHLSRVASPHSWGVAANIYRIGDEWLDSEETIEKYRALAREVLPGVWSRPFGDRPGYAFDHLHLDLGFLSVEPHHPEASAAGTTSRGTG